MSVVVPAIVDEMKQSLYWYVVWEWDHVHITSRLWSVLYHRFAFVQIEIYYFCKFLLKKKCYYGSLINHCENREYGSPILVFHEVVGLLWVTDSQCLLHTHFSLSLEARSSKPSTDSHEHWQA